MVRCGGGLRRGGVETGLHLKPSADTLVESGQAGQHVLACVGDERGDGPSGAGGVLGREGNVDARLPGSAFQADGAVRQAARAREAVVGHAAFRRARVQRAHSGRRQGDVLLRRYSPAEEHLEEDRRARAGIHDRRDVPCPCPRRQARHEPERAHRLPPEELRDILLLP